MITQPAKSSQYKGSVTSKCSLVSMGFINDYKPDKKNTERNLTEEKYKFIKMKWSISGELKSKDNIYMFGQSLVSRTRDQCLDIITSDLIEFD